MTPKSPSDAAECVKMRMSLSCRQQGEAGAVWSWSHWRGWGAHQSWPLVGLVSLPGQLPDRASCLLWGPLGLISTPREGSWRVKTQHRQNLVEKGSAAAFSGAQDDTTLARICFFSMKTVAQSVFRCPECWRSSLFLFLQSVQSLLLNKDFLFPWRSLVDCRSLVLLMNLHRVKRK